MASKWYGSLTNRLEENHDTVNEIKVGTGMTKYLWSDTHAFEVIAVKDQKHVTVRELNHRLAGEPMSNDWELFSDDSMPVYNLVKRGKYWYATATLTKEEAERLNDDSKWEYICAGIDFNIVMAKGKRTKYDRWNVSFGRAEYYYDYSF